MKRAKQSFAPYCVPKLELGNEGEGLELGSEEEGLELGSEEEGLELGNEGEGLELALSDNKFETVPCLKLV
jgi:hypothetical protein